MQKPRQISHTAVTVETGRVGKRRVVRLLTLDDLSAEVERITLAAAAGKIRSLGNRSPAQAIWHIGKLIELSFDGFPFRYRRSPEWAIRAIRLLSWRWLIALAFRPGVRNPAEAAVLEPDASLTPRGRRLFPSTDRAHSRRRADDTRGLN